MLSDAVVDTVALPLAKPARDAVTVAVPTDLPRSEALAPTAPWGMVIDVVISSTAAGFEVVRSTTNPPGGAGLGIVTGNEAVDPSPTLSVAGTDNTFWVTV